MKKTETFLKVQIASILFLMLVFPDLKWDVNMTRVAWWGSLYPRTMLEGNMRLVKEGEDGFWPVTEIDREIPVKIRWKCLELWGFGKDENGNDRN